jgi:hypothetical protein
MRTASFSVFLLALTFFAVSAEELAMDPNLEALRPFFGSWRGEFKNSTPEKRVIDIQLWERALNGKAVRITHSVNDGAYGGETFITWDNEKKGIVYHYFTTAGFQTTGTMKVDKNKLVCSELVKGSAQGTTEVESTFELTDDKTIKSVAKYLKNGKAEGSREVTYKRAEGAKPVFK